MQFTVDITDPKQIAAITAAREAYNAALPEQTRVVAGSAEGITPKPGTLASDAEYVQFVMASAADSYTKQFPK